MDLVFHPLVALFSLLLTWLFQQLKKPTIYQVKKPDISAAHCAVVLNSWRLHQLPWNFFYVHGHHECRPNLHTSRLSICWACFHRSIDVCPLEAVEVDTEWLHQQDAAGSHSSRNWTAGVLTVLLFCHDNHKCMQNKTKSTECNSSTKEVNEDDAFSWQPKGWQLFYCSLCATAATALDPTSSCSLLYPLFIVEEQSEQSFEFWSVMLTNTE